MHYNIIVPEGGGAKGPYELGVLEILEKKAGKLIKDFVKLSVCTSVGAVNSSFICTGKKSVQDWVPIVINNLPYVFKRRFGLFPIPRYDKKHYAEMYEKYVGKGLTLSELPIWMMCTSIDRCEPKTHLFKSWEDKDGGIPVIDATTRSFSATYYFGASIDEQASKIWMDGGMGYNNLPLMKAYIECMRQGWHLNGNTVHILAIGSGRKDETTPFCKAKKNTILGQTADQLHAFMDVQEGGWTRAMSTMEQVNDMKAIAACNPWLTFQFVDWVSMPKELDKMDNINARFQYYQQGLKDGEKIEIGHFKIN